MKQADDPAVTALMGSLAGDSLALAAHWIYDTSEITRRFGLIQALGAPGQDSYHRNRAAGDFTHYGDQTMVLLESAAETGGFDLDDFFHRWKSAMAGYDGYVDRATRTTLDNIGQGKGPQDCGSNSSDLAGAARLAPLLPILGRDLPALVQAARAQTRMTHNNPLVLDAAEFFARTAHAILEGASPGEAMKAASGLDYLSAPIADWTAQGLEFAATDTVGATAHFGQSCNVEGAFRSVVQITARHADDPLGGLSANVMAGGDSAARGLLAGLLLGCGPQGRALEPLSSKLSRHGDILDMVLKTNPEK